MGTDTSFVSSIAVATKKYAGSCHTRSVRYHASDVDDLSPRLVLSRNGSTSVFRVLNFSAQGVRFESDDPFEAFEVGDVDASAQLIAAGKVVFTAPLRIQNSLENEKKRVEYGARFLRKTLDVDQIFSLRDTLRERPQLSTTSGKKELFRGTRYGREYLEPLAVQAEIVFQEGVVVPVEIDNFSEFGFRLVIQTETPETVALEQGMTLPRFSVHLNGEPFFLGAITISNLMREQGTTTLGVLARGVPVPIQIVFNLLTEQALKLDVSRFFEEMKVTSRINPQFKIILNDVRYFFERMRGSLEQVETKISELSGEADQRWMENRIIEAYQKDLQAYTKDMLVTLDRLVATFSKDEHALHQRYFRSQMMPLVTSSAFFDRALRKPLGYAGDYEMMNLLYHGTLAGATLWERLINSALTDIPSGWAVRNRRLYLKEKIEQTIASASGPLHILSLACGPCEELYTYLTEHRDSMPDQSLTFYLVDQDRRALDYARTRLYPFAQIHHDKLRFVCLDYSVKDLLQNPQALSAYPKLDLAYSAGLYDYLDDNVASKLTAVLMSTLKPGGRLVIGNFNDDHDARFFIEYAANWFLIRRTQEQVLNFLSESKPYSAAEVEQEAAGVNLFLNAIK